MFSNKLLYAFAFSWPVIVMGTYDFVRKPITASPSTDAASAISEILRENPRRVGEILESWQTWQTASNERDAFNAGIQSGPGSIVYGPSVDASIGTMLVFYDANCAFCRRAHPILERLMTQNPGLRVVKRNTPILGQKSIETALVEIALAEQGFGKAFYEKVMQAEGEVGLDEAVAFARELGADMDLLQAALERPDLNVGLATNGRIAQLMRLTGTPLFVFQGQRLSAEASFQEMQEVIERHSKRPN